MIVYLTPPLEMRETDYLTILALSDRGWKVEFEREPETTGELARRLGIRINSLSRMLRLPFRLRTSGKAHPQMQQVMRPLLVHFQDVMPELFADIVPS